MRALIIASLFVTTSAFACPNLTGKYAECRTQNGEVTSTNMTVSQSVSGGVTTYTLTSTSAEDGETITEHYTANGRTINVNHTDPESGMTLQIATTASCEAKTALNVAVALKINGELLADVKVNVKKDAHRLVIASKGFSGEEQINDIVTCE